MILDLFEQAIKERRCLSAHHRGTNRHFAPHAVGFTSKGIPAAFVYQYAGDTTSRLPFRGEWRCLHFDDLAMVRANDDAWRTPPNYSLERQTCLKQIALSVPEPTSS
jgi:hypothetical protein